MNIDISNAHCGPRIQFPDHAWLRVVLIPKSCLRLRERTLDARPVARDDAPPRSRPSSLGVVRNDERDERLVREEVERESEVLRDAAARRPTDPVVSRSCAFVRKSDPPA